MSLSSLRHDFRTSVLTAAAAAAATATAEVKSN